MKPPEPTSSTTARYEHPNTEEERRKEAEENDLKIIL